MATSKAQVHRSTKKSQKNLIANWPVKAVGPPQLKTWEWVLSSLLGLLLLVMAVLQIVSFTDFKDNLEQAGLAGPTAWAVCIILAEVWGAAGFFKVPLSLGFRNVSYGLAVLVSGFWFIENLQLISNGTGEGMNSSGFFGRFLNQGPGWWTAVEVSIFLFLVLYMVSLLRDNQQTRR